MQTFASLSVMVPEIAFAMIYRRLMIRTNYICVVKFDRASIEKHSNVRIMMFGLDMEYPYYFALAPSEV